MSASAALATEIAPFIGPRGWVVDPSRAGREWMQWAPDGHPDRCQGRYRKAQCGAYAVDGRDYCAWHQHRKDWWTKHGPPSKRRRASLLRRHLSPTLQQKLEEAQAISPEARLSLLDEVELAKMVSAEAITKWELSLRSDNPETRAMGVSAARDAISYIVGIVRAATANRAILAGTIDADAIEYIVKQTVSIIESEIKGGLTEEQLTRICEKIRDIRVVAPNKMELNSAHVAIGIRQALIAADSTVPLEPMAQADVVSVTDPNAPVQEAE